MGLDMYAFATRTAPAAPVDFSAGESQELAYWRKHPNLHGWMEHLYRAKGGTAEDFNCVNLQLDAADLDALEHAVRSKTLPPTVGFFFGQTDGSEYEDDLAFIARAREALARGEARALGRPVAAHVRDRLFKRSAAQRRELLVDEAHRQIMAVMNNLHQLAVLSEIGAPCGSDIQHALRHVVSIYRRLGSRDQAGLMLTADILLKLRAEGVILNAVTRQWNRKQRELWNRTELLTAMAGVLKTLRLLESTPTATPQKASSAPAKALPKLGAKPVPKAGVKPTLRLKPLPPGGRR